MTAIAQNAVETLIDMVVAAVIEAPESEWPRHGVRRTLDPQAVAKANAFAAAHALSVWWREDWSDAGWTEDSRVVAGWFTSLTPGMDYTGTIGAEIATL